MKCMGKKQNVVAHSVTESALVSWRERHGEKRRPMTALEECMNNDPKKRYRSPNIVW